MNCDITTIIVCVEYQDFLSVTLPHNRPLLGRMLVVTDPEDERTISVAEENGVDVLTTKVFFEHNALFNKWAAVNQGFSYLSVSGWCLVLDADLLLPQSSVPWKVNAGKLYKARRTQVVDWKKKIEPEKNWKRYKKIRETPGGYFHLFHSSDPAVRKIPYLNCWRWCGTGDHEFESHWPEASKVLMPFDVLHLGTPEVNWCGRSEVFCDGSMHSKATERRLMAQSLRRQTRINAGLDDKYQGDRIQ
jgi:hypothetical protein